MALELRDVEVRAGPLLDQCPRVMEEEQPEIDEGARRRPIVDEEVPFE